MRKLNVFVITYVMFFMPLQAQSDLFDFEKTLLDGNNASSIEYSFFASDFDGDGDIDLAGIGSNGPRAYLNKGDLTFDTLDLFHGLELPAAIGDMNNDGNADFITSKAWYSISDIDNFQRKLLNLEGISFIRFAEDFNNDGFDDLVVVNDEPFEDEFLKVYKNIEADSFEIENIDISSSSYGIAISSDYNLDSRPDIFIPQIFEDKILTFRNVFGDFSKVNLNINTVFGFDSFIIAVEDMDGDEDKDIVLGSPVVGVYYLENDNLDFINKHDILPLEEVLSLEVGDLDNDEDLDVVCIIEASDDNYEVGYILNMGEDNWSDFQSLLTFTGFGNLIYQNPNHFDNWLQLVDIDMDGHLDIIVNAILDGTVIWFENLSTSATKPTPRNPDLNIYPQPSSDIIFIEGLHEGYVRFMLFDKSGALVFSSRTMNNNAIDLSALPAGIYTYTILAEHTDRVFASGKIVKGQ